MQIPQDFINLVRLLLHYNILHAKVNGHKGAPFKPSNGVQQGCGLSPLLYILVIQILLSLIHTANGQPGSNTEPFEGIPLPPARRGDSPARTHARVSAYADDLIGSLRRTSQLPAFQRLIATFEAGSGARMNWTKTFLYRIGAPDADADDPPPPDPDPTDIPFNTDTIRTLGIYVGTDDQITQAWKSHITHK